MWYQEFYSWWECQTGATHCESQCNNFSKAMNKTTYDSAISLFGLKSKVSIFCYRNTYSFMFIAALLQ